MHITRRWSIKKLSLAACACLILYILFSSGYNKYEIDTVISNTRPEEVWEYVADFNKMRVLNPTILSFKIVSDSGNTHDWRYSVEYMERMSHWPYWPVSMAGDFIVTKSMPGVEPAIFAIASKHQSCFLKGAYCLRAESEFKFSSLHEDTYCSEKINYQCPAFLGSACRRELEYQRKAVMHNLTLIFSKKPRAH